MMNDRYYPLYIIYNIISNNDSSKYHHPPHHHNHLAHPSLSANKTFSL